MSFDNLDLFKLHFIVFLLLFNLLLGEDKKMF